MHLGLNLNNSYCSNSSKFKMESVRAVVVVLSLSLTKNKSRITHRVTRDFYYYLLFTYQTYFTSSKITTTDYQYFTAYLVQIRSVISILNVINQQLSKSIRVMLFRFYFVLFSVFLSFVGAKVQINCRTCKLLWNKY